MIRRPRNGLKYAPIVAVAAVVLAAIAAVAPPKGASAADTLVTPEGVTINVYVDTVTVDQVYDWLLAAGLEPHVKLTRVDVVDEGMTMASVGGGCYPVDYPVQGCWVYNAAIQVTADNLLANPNFSLAHEYGHVWENYYRWTNWGGDFDEYLTARGLTGDPRVDSSHCWKASEILAEDYRQLFGSEEALTLHQCNRDIPTADEVPGLRDFLALTWTNGNPPPNYGQPAQTPAPTPESTSDPTPTVAPTPTPTSAPTPTPTPTLTQQPEEEPTPTATPTPATDEKTPPGKGKKDKDGGGGNNGKGGGKGGKK